MLSVILIALFSKGYSSTFSNFLLFWGGEFGRQQESGSGPLGEIQPETQQSTSEEEEAEESEEQGGDAQPGSETPAKPGLLFRLVRFVGGGGR